jgi:hypothetical protein
MGWFHVADGLFFRRWNDGVVQIGQGPDFDHVGVIQTIDASSWASVVSSMCARGENHLTYTEALDFHEKDA